MYSELYPGSMLCWTDDLDGCVCVLPCHFLSWDCAAAAAAACVEFCLLFLGLSLSYCFSLWCFLASIDR